MADTKLKYLDRTGLQSVLTKLKTVYATTAHTHGNVTTDGKITNAAVAIQSGNHIVVTDKDGKLANGVQFNSATATGNQALFLREDGTWVKPYTHSTFTSAAAAAIKVGRDAEGHVVLGSALTPTDVGLSKISESGDAVTIASNLDVTGDKVTVKSADVSGNLSVTGTATFGGAVTIPDVTAGDSSGAAANTKFVAVAISSAISEAIASTFRFMGTIGTSAALAGLSDASTPKPGHAYRVQLTGTTEQNEAFVIDGVKVENGDLIICTSAGSTGAEASWTVVQNNIDTTNISAVHADSAVTAGTAGRLSNTAAVGSDKIPVYFTTAGVPAEVSVSTMSVGTAGTATRLANTTAIGAENLPVYIDANGTPQTVTLSSVSGVGHAASATTAANALSLGTVAASLFATSSALSAWVTSSATAFSAATAAKLATTTAGTSVNPVYFAEGVPVAVANSSMSVGTAGKALGADKLNLTAAVGTSAKPVYFGADGLPVEVTMSALSVGHATNASSLGGTAASEFATSAAISTWVTGTATAHRAEGLAAGAGSTNTPVYIDDNGAAQEVSLDDLNVGYAASAGKADSVGDITTSDIATMTWVTSSATAYSAAVAGKAVAYSLTDAQVTAGGIGDASHAVYIDSKGQFHSVTTVASATNAASLGGSAASTYAQQTWVTNTATAYRASGLSTSAGDSATAVYIDENGAPQAVDVVGSATHADSATNATVAAECSGIEALDEASISAAWVGAGLTWPTSTTEG